MIDYAVATWEKLADIVNQIGKEDVISIQPVAFSYSSEGLVTHHGQKTEGAGTLIVDKYLILYENGR